MKKPIALMVVCLFFLLLSHLAAREHDIFVASIAGLLCLGSGGVAVGMFAEGE
jgi:hypothetical protein